MALPRLCKGKLYGEFMCKLIVRFVLSLFVLHTKEGPTGAIMMSWVGGSLRGLLKRPWSMRRSPRKLWDLGHFQRTKCTVREPNSYANFKKGVQSPNKISCEIQVKPWLRSGGEAPGTLRVFHFQSKKCSLTNLNFYARSRGPESKKTSCGIYGK